MRIRAARNVWVCARLFNALPGGRPTRVWIGSGREGSTVAHQPPPRCGRASATLAESAAQALPKREATPTSATELRPPPKQRAQQRHIKWDVATPTRGEARRRVGWARTCPPAPRHLPSARASSAKHPSAAELHLVPRLGPPRRLAGSEAAAALAARPQPVGAEPAGWQRRGGGSSEKHGSKTRLRQTSRAGASPFHNDEWGRCHAQSGDRGLVWNQPRRAQGACQRPRQQQPTAANPARE